MGRYAEKAKSSVPSLIWSDVEILCSCGHKNIT